MQSDPRSLEFSRFVDRVIDYLRRKRKDGQGHHPECTFDEIWNHRMSSDDRNSFPSFQKKGYLQKEFASRIHDNPKIHFDSVTNKFTFKKKFEDPDALVTKLYQDRTGVEDKEDLHDDISPLHIEGLVEKNLLRLVEIKENKSKTIRILLSKNIAEDPIEKLNLEETIPLELGSYWDQFDKSQHASERYSKYSASEYLYRDPKMTIKQKSGKRRRRFFDDADIRNWQNQHLFDKIEEAMDILDKQAPPEHRRPVRKTMLKKRQPTG